MMLCPYFTHRLPELWEEPERFRPERFLDGSAQARLHRASYYPFGYGQRTCIGNHLATMEMQLVVAMLAQKFELTCSPSAPPVEPEFSTALRPRGGLWMRVRRRHMPVHPSQIR
jgi:cytochrome P450